MTAGSGAAASLSEVSLTPYFNNYLCWEMNEWIGGNIWDAIYLDECYEEPMRNLEAGFSVRLPEARNNSACAISCSAI